MASRRVGARAPWTIAACILGGALTCAGATLPWLSFFAGLQSYSGLVGLYGRVLFAAGALAVAGGATMLVRRETWLRAAVGVLGVVETLFVAWLLVGLRQTIHGLGMHAMLLARAGPGLDVALAGALLTASTVVPWRRAASAAGGRAPGPA